MLLVGRHLTFTFGAKILRISEYVGQDMERRECFAFKA